ncbi:MAG: SH3 domain-containing protein [Prevotella sp.]|nr:SH3 domain-containing protein [Prevotella sp.]
MKKRILCLMAFVLVLGTANAQRLVAFKGYGKNWGTEKVSTKNKPNGFIYRLRQEKQCTDLPQVEETKGLQLFIAEQIDMGWLALYRLPMADDNYNFVVVLYNHDKKPQTTINLCDITNNRYCEVQDVRWDADNHYLLFNMACPSYASQINGKGSKLYCYDVKQRRMVWETDYLVSNDIFTLNSDFVFCSYGFTNEKKFLYMLDKQTGKVYTKQPMVYKVQYMELQQKGGKEMLYVVDYNDNLYTYSIVGKPAQAKSAAAQKQPEVFTVVFTTSDDGFLNVRSQPSNSGTILSTVGIAFHGLGNGVLREKGDKWSKVSVGDVTGWAYNKYLGYQDWYDGTGKTILVALRDNTPIYGENYADEGDYPLFTTVKKGTVIADQYDQIEGYYVLKTAHDFLFIKKGDVEVRTR